MHLILLLEPGFKKPVFTTVMAYISVSSFSRLDLFPILSKTILRLILTVLGFLIPVLQRNIQKNKPNSVCNNFFSGKKIGGHNPPIFHVI